MSLRRVVFCAVLAGALSIAAPLAHAEGGIDPPPAPSAGGGDPILDGCTDSPEFPTAILAVLGSAGVGTGLKLRSAVRKRGAADLA